MSSSGAWVTCPEAVRTGGSSGATTARAWTSRIRIVPSHERLQHAVGADPPRRDGAAQGQAAARLLRVGHGDRVEDLHRAVGVLVLDRHVDVIEVEGGPGDAVVLLHRLGHPPHVDRVDRLGRDVAAAQRLDRRGPLEQEELVLLDERRRQVLGGEQLVARDAEALGQADEQKGMRRRLAADGVLAALLDHERDQRPLALQILERRRVAAHGDDLPGGVPERVEEEAALLGDDVAKLALRELTVPDHSEEPMVQPGMGVLRLAEQRGRELGWWKRHGDLLSRIASLYSPPTGKAIIRPPWPTSPVAAFSRSARRPPPRASAACPGSAARASWATRGPSAPSS